MFPYLIDLPVKCYYRAIVIEISVVYVDAIDKLSAFISKRYT